MDPGNYLERFPHLRIAVIGDIILDEYIWGICERISPEAPVPVVHVRRVSYHPGGAFNVALNLRNLQVQVFLAGILGEDPEANRILAEFQQQPGLENSLLYAVRGRPTTRKTRVIAQAQHVVRIDRESTSPLPSGETEKFLEEFFRQLKSFRPHLLIIEDYEKGLLYTESISFILEFCQEHQIPVAVDPKFLNFWQYRNCALFKCNMKELRAQFPYLNPEDEKALAGVLKEAGERLQTRWMIVTAGERGAYAWTPEDGFLHVPATPVELVDVTGAGDTFMAVVSAMFGVGAPIEEALKLATCAGSLTCQRLGPHAPDLATLKARCSGGSARY